MPPFSKRRALRNERVRSASESGRGSGRWQVRDSPQGPARKPAPAGRARICCARAWITDGPLGSAAGLAGAVAATVLGTRAARLDQTLLQGLSRTEDAHARVTGRQAALLGE